MPPDFSADFVTRSFPPFFGAWKITRTSTEGQKLHENLAPVLVIISGKSLVFSRKIVTSTGFYRYCAPSASAPVVVINGSPTFGGKQCPEESSRKSPGKILGTIKVQTHFCRQKGQQIQNSLHPKTCDPEVLLQTPKPRKIQRHKKVTQK